MSARLSHLAVVALALTGRIAAADPKPKPVDVKALRDKMVVLQDKLGITYVVVPGPDAAIYLGTGKALYAQRIRGGSADGSTGAWSVDAIAPHAADTAPGSVFRRADGSYAKSCNTETTELTQRSGDAAKQILDKASFMTTALTRRPLLLARDDAGVYYYVDQLYSDYGGKGYRVFVGKKGAMRELPLTDVADDSGGQVFSTKTGDLRLVHDSKTSDAVAATVTWVRGEKRSPLVSLDLYMNSPVIYRDLGVYSFTGTICDEL